MNYSTFYQNYILRTNKPIHIKTMKDGSCEVWLYTRCIKAFDSTGIECNPSGLPYFE